MKAAAVGKGVAGAAKTAATILYEATRAAEAVAPISAVATLTKLFCLCAGFQCLVPLVILRNAIILLQHTQRLIISAANSQGKPVRTLILASSISLAICSSWSLTKASNAGAPPLLETTE
ncbi:unnamed protein product [Phytophthora lilii]|uniref:Unnamed protein product n=1 Tax=Phytophthora lilii TaxID=2077276 RepID=A0A9W6TXB9_9STRA|nr:unnamed protein product [Phytophthora lilii]